MHPYDAWIADRGGLIATHELHAAGVSRAEIAVAVRRRLMFRVRQGWYAAPHTHPDLLRAARVGGQATCSTGLALHGIWVRRRDGLHVACAPHDARLRSPHDSRQLLGRQHDVRVHWRHLPTEGSRLHLPALSCLRDAIACMDDEELAQSADSLLRMVRPSAAQWSGFCAASPRRVRALPQAADGVCESGSETLLWRRLRLHAVSIRRQVPVPDVGRVDFVVGDRLVIEVDGEAYHAGTGQFEGDRRRDALLTARGYRVLRFSYRQVMNRIAEVDAAVRSAIARGDHRIPDR